MKKLFLAVALLATSMVASAQFAAGNGGSSFGSSSVSGHNSFYVQYNSFGTGEYGEEYAETMEDLEDYLEDMDNENVEIAWRTRLNGLTIGYNHAFGITPSVPLFVEFGAGLTYAWANVYEQTNERYDEYACGDDFSTTVKEISQHLLVNVPINLMYKFQLPNSSITLEPYVGLNLRGHILGRLKTKYTYEACCDDMEDYLEEEIEDIDEDDLICDYFDKDDVDERWDTKKTATRFNVGWQIGVNADLGQAFVGISYGSDFNNYAKWDGEEVKLNAVNVTVGLRF